MSDWQANHLVEALRRLDEASRRPAGDDAPPRGEGRLAAELRALGGALRAGSAPVGEHLDESALRGLAAARRGADAEWELSPHLATCGLCLEAFEALVEGGEFKGAALERFTGLWALRESAERNVEGGATTHRGVWPRRLVRLAAAAVVLLAVGLALAFYHRSTSARVEDAGLAYSDGTAIAAGATIPDGAELIAQADARTAFQDGSRIDVEKDTHVAFRESLGGDTTIDLRRGGVTASVTKRVRGRQFGVKTPLGDVVVVGTKFSVSSRSEDVTVYDRQRTGQPPRRQEKITAVTVKVFEGRVLVRNKFQQQASVAAGSVAVLREGQPTIDVSGGL